MTWRWLALAAVCCAGVAQADDVEQWTPANALSQPMFDAQTLRHRWIAADMHVGTEVDAKPVIRDRDDKPTGKVGAAVRAVISNSHGPTYKLDLGTLDVSTYVIRVVAMVPTDQLVQWRRPLVLEVTVNDRPGGGKTVYRQRIPYWDTFYAVAEVYFNADEARHYEATVKVADGSEAPLYVHAIELHDCLGGLVGRATKTLPGTYRYDERARVRAAQRPDDVIASVGKDVALDPYLTGKQELTAEQRRDRDDVLWHAVLPANTQYLMENDEDWVTNDMRAGPLTRQQVVDRYGSWDAPPFQVAWRTPLVLRNKKLGRDYTLADLVAHSPLPSPYPFHDRGDGVYFPALPGLPHPTHWLPIAAVLGWWFEGTRLALAPYHGNNVDRRLAYLYYATGNTHAARDAAFMLARWAYLYPSLTDAQALGFSIIAPSPTYKRDFRLRWQRFGYMRSANLMLGLLHSYDQLFDYIQGNQELAQAVSRYVPWVRTDADLRRMIETRLVQYSAKQLMRWQRWDDKDTPTWLMLAAAVQQDPAVTRPWVDQLWHQTWVYPYPPAGVPDLLSTTTQRDGTTSIGSVYYAQSGSPFAELVDLSHRYVANGGDPAFSLENMQLYGKLMAAPLFPLEATIAGGFPMTIGDVGAIDKPRLFDQIQDLAANWRRGWEWTHDKRLAWIIVNYLGRASESDREWSELERAAAACGRNPFLVQRSRVLANWAGILEAGAASDDYRFKRTAYLRVGTGYGHSHQDTLDLQISAHGVRLAGDLGWRGEYSQPSADSTLLHNRIEVDDKNSPQQGNWQGHAWIREILPLEGTQYMTAVAEAPTTHATVKSYRRAIGLIDVTAGEAKDHPHRGIYRGGETAHDKGVVEPESYVLDVQRIDGGTHTTWCFHGPWSDRFDIDMAKRHEVGPAGTDSSPEAAYLRKFLDGPSLKLAGETPSDRPLTVTWRLRRTDETLTGADPHDGKPVVRQQHNAEKQMLGADYDEAGAQKFLRTYLLGHGGDTVLVARPTPIGPQGVDSTWPFVFVRSSNEQPAGAVYAAVHEPYADHPFLSKVEPIEVRDAGVGADRAVAIGVTTISGRRDELFSDGDPVRAHTFGGATARAAFAFHSADARGLVTAEIVDGTTYQDRSLQIHVGDGADVPSNDAKIDSVDYLRREIRVRTTLPAELWIGQHIEIGNELHHTSFGVIAAHTERACVVLTLDAAADLSYAHVKEVAADKGEVVANLGPVDVATYPGMNGGLTLTNADMTRAWKVKRVIGDQPGRGYVYSIADKLDPSALPAGSTIRVWEFGVGDTVHLASFVRLQRIAHGPDAGRYELSANAAVTVTAAGKRPISVTPAQLARRGGTVIVDL